MLAYGTSGLARALGVSAGDPPYAVTCPLCGGAEKLEIGNWQRIVCRKCGFFGSAVALYGKIHGQTPGTAIRDLIQMGALRVSEDSLEKFVTDEAMAVALLKHHLEFADRLRHAPSSVRGILQTRGVAADDQDLVSLIPHCVAVQADDIDGICDLAGLKSLMGKYMHIGIGTFSNSLLTGYWLIGSKNIVYAPVNDVDTTEIGVGFGLMASPADRGAIILDDPVATLRMQLRHFRDEGRLGPFVCPARYPYAADFGYIAGPQVFWSTGNTVEHTVNALRTHQASVLPQAFLGGINPARDPTPQTARQVVDRALREALPPARAMANYCLGRPAADAKAALLTAKLTDTEKEACLLACSAEEAENLNALFGTISQERSIEWGNSKIVETPAGWMIGKKIVSQAVLRIEHIQADGVGDAQASGYVRYRHHRFTFKARLSELRRKPAEWLHSFVLNRANASPVIDPTLGRRLIDIAQLFHEPRTADPVASAGWSGEGVLRFPLFAIDGKGIHPGAFDVVGPAMPPPQLLTAQEYAALEDRAFCELLLAVLGNLTRMAQGLSPFGLAVQNRPFVVERYAGALSMNPVTRLSELGSRLGSDYPLPIPVRTDESGLRPLFETATQAHVLTSFASASFACLGLSGRWLRLTQGAPIDYRPLRLALLVLPTVLKSIESGKMKSESPSLYRDLADALKRYGVGTAKRNHLHSVAAALDQNGIAQSSQLSGRLMTLIWQASRAEALEARETPDGIAIRWEALLGAYSRSIVPLPPAGDALEILRDAKYAVGTTTQGEWLLDRELWTLHSSLV